MDRAFMPAAMPAELAERLSDVGREWTMAEAQEIERATEKRIDARLADPQFWADGLDGISETQRVARLLAGVTGATLDRACNDPAGPAMNEILMALAKFQKDTRASLRDSISEEVEAEMVLEVFGPDPDDYEPANGGIES